MQNNNPHVHLPLHIHITALFAVLILGFGALISWLQYSDSSKVIQQASETLFEQTADEITNHYHATHHAVEDLVELLASSSLIATETLVERKPALTQLSIVLAQNPKLSQIGLGYKNGDFFVARQISKPLQLNTFSAPKQTRFILDHIETASGESRQQRLFFSKTLKLLEQQDMGAVSYDPRQRPWFRQALTNDKTITTPPYYFRFMQELGVTLARETEHAVVAADITLTDINETLSEVEFPKSAQRLLISPGGKIFAYPDSPQTLHQAGQLSHIDALEHPTLKALGARLLEPGKVRITVTGQEWWGRVKKIAFDDQSSAYLAVIVPKDELMAEAYAQQWRNLMVTLGLLALIVPATWYLANKIAAPLRQLAQETTHIQALDFSARTLPSTRITEIVKLNAATVQMKQTINRFLKLTQALAAEPDLTKLQEQVVRQTRKVSQSDGVILWLQDAERKELEAACVDLGASPYDASRLPKRLETEHEQLFEEGYFSLTRSQAGPGYASLFTALDCDTLEIHRLPLRDRSKEPLGILHLLSRPDQNRAGKPLNKSLRQSFLRELSGFAAVSIESSQLLAAQKNLLESFIKLLASAIDAKSPYTGGHCERVPEISKMLAQAACDSTEEEFAGFSLDEQGWEALHIASWLHDCGKVTTPEYVVDKATKLETVHDRIHEVRMRFEVLKRDAELEYWKALQKQPQQKQQAELKQELDQQLATLDEEFSFIATCNLGGEFMADDKIERLKQIAARTWQRTLNDRLGVSHEELARHEQEPLPSLPVTEPLLADKTWHRIERTQAGQTPDNNGWGFKIETPELEYNRGELYNLSIARGTLTAEERYRINDHIMQTIMMLKQLPFPKHLRQVPQIAGGHHEKMDGTGYPCQLTGDQMPVTARMLAIADVFEALTASDRPYKPAKKLSEALKIMHFMCRDGHLDPTLFHLFLDSGIPEQYARHYLAPSQIDTIDKEQYKVTG